jgi:hypothetical protein
MQMRWLRDRQHGSQAAGDFYLRRNSNERIFLFVVSSCLMLAGCAAGAPPIVYEPASNGKYPNSPFTGLIFARDANNFSSVQQYKGRTVRITGKNG